jgi:hypothetical protein
VSDDEERRTWHVPGWFVAVWAGVQAMLGTALELFPTGTPHTVVVLLNSGWIAAGGAVAMKSSGIRRRK